MSEVANCFAVNDADSDGYYMCVDRLGCKIWLANQSELCKRLDSESRSFLKQIVLLVSDSLCEQEQASVTEVGWKAVSWRPKLASSEASQWQLLHTFPNTQASHRAIINIF
jgi:predicted metal-dependent phosphotriesterase family hydrolase